MPTVFTPDSSKTKTSPCRTSSGWPRACSLGLLCRSSTVVGTAGTVELVLWRRCFWWTSGKATIVRGLPAAVTRALWSSCMPTTRSASTTPWPSSAPNVSASSQASRYSIYRRLLQTEDTLKLYPFITDTTLHNSGHFHSRNLASLLGFFVSLAFNRI